MSVPISHHSHHDLLLSVFLVLATPVSMKWYLIVILISISCSQVMWSTILCTISHFCIFFGIIQSQIFCLYLKFTYDF